MQPQVGGTIGAKGLTLAIPSFGHNFDEFIHFLHEPNAGASVLSPKRFTALMNMDIQELATQAHVHRNTITRAPESESLQRFIREAVRVVRAAADISGDIDRAIFWYRNEPLPVFKYKTAETLVSEGRADDVLNYVMSLQAGATG
ncbi:MAG: DUF2384 domain-containing protein [Ottowia sp.]|nr:DUF2384 domain-containing protein [Ottowia sp.]